MRWPEQTGPMFKWYECAEYVVKWAGVVHTYDTVPFHTL